MVELELYRSRIGNFHITSMSSAKSQVMYGGCRNSKGSVSWLTDILNFNVFIILYAILMLYGSTVGVAMSLRFRDSPNSDNLTQYIIKSTGFDKCHVIISITTRQYAAILSCLAFKYLNSFPNLTFSKNFTWSSIVGMIYKVKCCLTDSILRVNLNPALKFDHNYLQVIVRYFLHVSRSMICKLLVWLSILNIILIVIANPSITNPGPNKSMSASSLKFVFQNVQGLIPLSALNNPNPALNVTKLTELQAYVYSNKPDVVVLNETWLKPSITDNEIFSCDSYNIFRLDRSKKSHPYDALNPSKFRKNGGGVLIATRADLDIAVKPIKHSCLAEIIGVQLDLPNGQKIIICTLYRVGTLGNENLSKVETYLQNISKRRGISNLILLGDMNLNGINWDTLACKSEIEQSFIDVFDSLGLHQLVKSPTHYKGNILDLVLSTQQNSISNLSVFDNDAFCKSDHNPITFNVRTRSSRTKATRRRSFNFKKANWRALNEDLAKINWNSMIDNSANIETAWLKFKQTLLDTANRHIPTITFKSDFQPPWFDAEVYELCRDKERLRKLHKNSQSDESYMKFSNCRRELKRLVKSKMKDNFASNNDTVSINKKFWAYVKSANNCHRIPNSVNYNGNHRTNKVDQAELFNKFFYDQFSAESQYNISIDNSVASNNLFAIDFNRDEICKLLREINPNKAQGPDGIHGQLLKNCAATICFPLCKLFKMSYNSSQIPNDWKLANVVPVHKKGSKNSVENYRPISLTSLVMKQFEKIVRSELMSRCEHIINTNQHGFLPQKSCTTQLVQFSDNIARSLNNNSHIDVVYFDFAKAFDSVSHDILLHKLKYIYHIDGLLLNFIKCYLQDRQQRVVIGNCVSVHCKVNSGVPQGSIVGPLLFVLFINDISDEISSGTSIALYADDTKIWREIGSDVDNHILQCDITNLQNWADKNKMKFHPAKCHVLSMSRKRLPHLNSRFVYMLNGVNLEYVSSENDLGILMTSKLNFTDHCNKLYSKANSRLGLNKRTCHFLTNSAQKRKIYLVMVRSLFEHCSVVWKPYNQTTKNKLESIQKRAVKWILNEEYSSYSEIEYIMKCKELNFLPLNFHLLLNDLVLFHKIIRNLSPIKLPNYLHFYTENSRLRSSHLDEMSLVCDIRPKIHAKYSKNTVDGAEFRTFENSYFYRSHLNWNKLHMDIRRIENPVIFKTCIRKYLWGMALQEALIHCEKDIT